MFSGSKHALVVAYLALILAMSGTAYALAVTSADIVNGTIRSRDVKNDALTGADIRETTLRSGALRRVGEPVEIENCEITPPTTGQFCMYTTGGRWQNYGNGFAPAGFYKDLSGTVHLQGSVATTQGGDGQLETIFILPRAFRPSAIRLFGVYDDSAPNDFAYVKVYPDGQVTHTEGGDLANTTFLQLDGISFRP